MGQVEKILVFIPKKGQRKCPQSVFYIGIKSGPSTVSLVCLDHKLFFRLGILIPKNSIYVPGMVPQTKNKLVREGLRCNKKQSKSWTMLRKSDECLSNVKNSLKCLSKKENEPSQRTPSVHPQKGPTIMPLIRFCTKGQKVVRQWFFILSRS